VSAEKLIKIFANVILVGCVVKKLLALSHGLTFPLHKQKEKEWIRSSNKSLLVCNEA